MACAGTAGAQHNQVEWISNGPTGASATGHTCTWACPFGISADGTRVAFTTAAALVAEDTDAWDDVYLNDSGSVTLVSTGPTGGNGSNPVRYGAATPDLSKIFFESDERLVLADTDGRVDLYEWAGGTTTLISTGEAGGNGNFNASFAQKTPRVFPVRVLQGLVSDDGNHVFFQTAEQLSLQDTDAGLDVYERSNGTTRLVSTAGTFSAQFVAASSDGAKVFYQTTGDQLFVNAGGTITEIPAGGSGHGLHFDAITRDGGRAFFTTRASLVPSDQDANGCTDDVVGSPTCEDLYEYSGGTVTLVSAKPDGTGASGGRAVFEALSADEQHVFFTTGDQLTPDDTDLPFCSRWYWDEEGYPHEYFVPCVDVYDRSGGTTTLVSTGPTAGASDTDARFNDASADGSHVLFETDDPVIAEDTDFGLDVFDRSSGTSTLVSIGPLPGGWGDRGLISADGTRVLFRSSARLMPEDTDSPSAPGDYDIYERVGGRTYLLTDFTDTFSFELVGSTPDRRHVFIETHDGVAGADTDVCSGVSTPCTDLYRVSVGPASGYPRPKGASPTRVPLVPAFEPCTAPNRSHGAPLSFPSCAPPSQSSGSLTVGTDDANGNGQRSLGFVTLSTKTGNPATEVDDADVMVRLSITDVRMAGTLADYTGELQGQVSIRLTDNGRSAPITNPPQTIQDLPFRFTALCAATTSTLIGSACDVTTTADALVPGMVREDHRGLWELGQVEVLDGGPDGDVDTPGNTVFARQGVFVP